LKVFENKGKLLNLHSYREFSLSFNSLSTIQLKNTYSIMDNSTSQRDNLKLTQENTLEDNYDLTWGQLPIEVFRSVGLHLDLQHGIMPLLCVCKRMTIKVLRELCYVTGYYPNADFWTALYPPMEIKLTRRVFPSSSFYLHPLLLSYTSSWWHMVEDPRLIIHCLIINFHSEVTYSKPLSNLWDLSKLNSLVIKIPKRFVQDKQICLSETGNLPLLEELLDQYQLPSLNEMVLLNPYITSKTWGHLNSNLKSIQLVNCRLESSCNINLRKFKYLKKFTILLEPMGNASCESCLDLTKCTMEFPGMSERLKFKDDQVLRVL
jgi:hypothetical protein